MNDRNSFLALITILIMSLPVAGCAQTQSSGGNVTDPWGVVTVGPGRKLRISMALSNTSTESQDAELARGTELAIQRYKEIAGFPIELVPTTAECSTAGGQAAATQITGDTSIVAVIGPDCSSACQSSTSLFDQAHYTAISPSCSANNLSDPILHVGAFVRTIYPDALEGYLAAQYAYRELGARRAAIIGDGTIETQDAVEAFRARMTTLGGKIIAEETIVSGDPAVAEVLGDIGAQKPDLVYAPLVATDAVALVTLRPAVAGLAQVPLLGGRHYWSDRIIQTTAQAANGIYATGPYVASASLGEVSASYQSLYNQTPTDISYAYAYDAVGILVEALNKVVSKGDQGSLVIGRKALQDAIYSTTNYPGLTGKLTCTNWGDCGTENLAVGQVQNGKWVVVYMP